MEKKGTGRLSSNTSDRRNADRNITNNQKVSRMPAAQKKLWGYRHKILLVIWLLYVINYLDRISVLTLLPYIGEDLQLSTKQLGWLGSIFFFGYALAQFSAGILSDRIGAKKTMSIAIVMFTAITFLTGLVKNFTQFFVLRLGLALGEGHHYTPSIKTITNWFPAHEKGRANGFFATTFGIAPMVTPIMVTWMAATFFNNNWRPVFFCLAVPGLLGIFLLWKFIYNSPREGFEKGVVEQQELDMIVESIGEDASVTGKRYSTKIITTDVKFYLYSIAWFMQLMIYWGMTTWIAFFLVNAHGYDIKTMGIMAGLPYLAAIIAQYFGGVAADKFFGGRPRILCLIAYLGCIPVLYLIGQVPQGQTLPLLILLLLGGFFINLNWSVIQAYPSYRYPKEVVGRAMGFANGIGQFGAFLSPLAAGYLVTLREDGSSDFANVFLFWSIISAIAGLCFYFLKETPVQAERFLIRDKTP